jgi:hypothetical protein
VNATSEFKLEVGTVYRLPAWGGGFRVWRVMAVMLGASDTESLVELKMDATPAGRKPTP